MQISKKSYSKVQCGENRIWIKDIRTEREIEYCKACGIDLISEVYEIKKAYSLSSWMVRTAIE